MTFKEFYLIEQERRRDQGWSTGQKLAAGAAGAAALGGLGYAAHKGMLPGGWGKGWASSTPKGFGKAGTQTRSQVAKAAHATPTVAQQAAATQFVVPPEIKGRAARRAWLAQQRAAVGTTSAVAKGAEAQARASTVLPRANNPRSLLQRGQDSVQGFADRLYGVETPAPAPAPGRARMLQRGSARGAAKKPSLLQRLIPSNPLNRVP